MRIRQLTRPLLILVVLFTSLGVFPAPAIAQGSPRDITGSECATLTPAQLKTILESITFSTVNFNCSARTFDFGELSTPVQISPTITSIVDTRGSITFDGRDIRQLIKIGSGQTLMIDKLTFRRGKAGATISIGGGAIFVDGGATVTLSNCNFFSNVAQGYTDGANLRSAEGGAVRNQGTLRIQRGYFSNNAANATIAIASDAYGGAIANFGKLTIEDSVLVGNFATSFPGRVAFGGAIHNAQPNTGLTITNTVFQQNDARGSVNASGGAIYDNSDNNAALVTISGSKFLQNTAQDRGSALYSSNVSGLTEVTDSLFDNNNNTALVHKLGTMNISMSRFVSNTAGSTPPRYGGAIWNSSGDATILTVTNTEFIMNSALSGGAFHNELGAITITGVRFENNSSSEVPPDDASFPGGGAVLNRRIGSNGFNPSLTIQGTEFSSNRSKAYGGAIFNGLGGTLFLSNSTLFGNTVGDATNLNGTGAAIFNHLNATGSLKSVYGKVRAWKDGEASERTW